MKSDTHNYESIGLLRLKMNAENVRSGIRLWAAITVAALLLIVPNISNAIRLETTWAQRVDQSEVVVRGGVISVKSYWNAQHTMIYTDVTIRADEYLKGQGPTDKIITLPGGSLGGDTVSVSDVPVFEEGNYGIVLLTPSGYVTGGPDGLYLMMNTHSPSSKALSTGEDRFLLWINSYIKGQTGSTFEELPDTPLNEMFPKQSTGMFPKALQTASITGVSPATISAGTGDVLTVYGSGFGVPSGYAGIYLRFKDNVYGNAFAPVQSWSDTQIAVKVNTAIVQNYNHSPGSWSNNPYGTVAFIDSAGAFSSFYPLSVPFGYGRAKWNSSPVKFYVNASGGPSGTLAAIQAAASTWSDADANFAFQYVPGWSGACELANDGANKICFTGGFPDPNIIAWAASYSSSGIITGADIQFNTDFPFSITTPPQPNSMDLQTISVHEMGHWLVLNDLYGNDSGGLNDLAKVMYGRVGFAEERRSLTSDDTAGIRWIYPVAATRTLTVTKTGQGTVSSNPAGINCGTDCSEDYTTGTSVILTSTPATGYTFASWSGDCTGTNPTCNVSMTAAKSATATFNLIQNTNPGGTATGLNNLTVTCANTSTNQGYPVTLINNSWVCVGSPVKGNRIIMTIKGVAQ